MHRNAIWWRELVSRAGSNSSEFNVHGTEFLYFAFYTGGIEGYPCIEGIHTDIVLAEWSETLWFPDTQYNILILDSRLFILAPSILLIWSMYRTTLRSKAFISPKKPYTVMPALLRITTIDEHHSVQYSLYDRISPPLVTTVCFRELSVSIVVSHTQQGLQILVSNGFPAYKQNM